ncbi:MAG: FeoB-associated Cys-rich membrane protein [Clostridia bacterium]|nr:FeoB-associated Cys-rich membrane protein [Clostridia bacterium]MBO7548737.1 FeoB-associated Cys-rich membrane protein [Clostridia bacterium]MBP5238733.1 FeoB-associated Cys-rich membrane protein [Clostridia bacterium]MBP5755619.1 FeoB-associated Cys-rich membrane protein [Clostridia bacterium]
MFAWIADNALTIATVAAVLLMLGFALYSVIKDKKNSKGGCTGNCATCGMGCSCCGKKKK